MLTLARNSIEKFIELVFSRLEAFTDYYLVTRHITLSETSLFIFSITWLLWTVVFPIQDASLISRPVWPYIFGSVVFVHFFSFFLADVFVRVIVSYIYAVLWCSLLLLVLYIGVAAPVAPMLLVLTLMSVVIGFRLSRERKLQQ